MTYAQNAYCHSYFSMNYVVMMYPNSTPKVDEISSTVSHTCFCLSVAPNMSDHTGKYMLIKTWKKPVINLLAMRTWYYLVITKSSCEKPFKIITIMSTYLVLHFWNRIVAPIDPMVNPANTVLPSRPYNLLLIPKASLITIEPAGITPWSTFISMFMNRTRIKRKLTTALLNCSLAGMSSTLSGLRRSRRLLCSFYVLDLKFLPLVC